MAVQATSKHSKNPQAKRPAASALARNAHTWIFPYNPTPKADEWFLQEHPTAFLPCCPVSRIATPKWDCYWAITGTLLMLCALAGTQAGDRDPFAESKGSVLVFSTTSSPATAICAVLWSSANQKLDAGAVPLFFGYSHISLPVPRDSRLVSVLLEAS